MTSAEYNYCGKFKKVWNNVDFLAMTVNEIRAKASEVVRDEDTIYYMKDGVTPDKGYESLISDEQIERVARVSRFTGVVKLHVYHAYQGPSLGFTIAGSEEGGGLFVMREVAMLVIEEMGGSLFLIYLGRDMRLRMLEVFVITQPVLI